jgi:hypothetical protein
MKNRLKFCCFLLLSLIGLQDNAALSQTPAPAVQTSFQITLTDKTTATSIFLPIKDGQVYLVYATSAGKLGVYYLTPTQPIPPPEPPVIITSVNVIMITETTPATANTELQTFLAQKKGKFNAYTVSSVGEADPPAEALKWVGRTAGKTYPYTFAIDQSENIIWEGTTPNTTAELIARISGVKIEQPPAAKPPPPINPSNTCPGGVCPPAQTWRRR